MNKKIWVLMRPRAEKELFWTGVKKEAPDEEVATLSPDIKLARRWPTKTEAYTILRRLCVGRVYLLDGVLIHRDSAWVLRFPPPITPTYWTGNGGRPTESVIDAHAWPTRDLATRALASLSLRNWQVVMRTIELPRAAPKPGVKAGPPLVQGLSDW